MIGPLVASCSCYLCFVPDYIPIRVPRSAPGPDFATSSSSLPASPAVEPIYGSTAPPLTPSRLKPVSFEMLDRPATPLLKGETIAADVMHEDGVAPPPRPPLPNSYSNPGTACRTVQL